MKTLVMAVFFFLIAGTAVAQKTIRKEIAVGHAPLELVKSTIKDALSGQGRFVLLPNNGSMMVIDTPENIKLVEAAIANLEVPNPNVGLNFAFKTGVAGGGGRATNRVIRGGPQAYDEIAFPTRFLPAQILPNGSGGFLVVPPHPTDFRRRNVGTTLDTQSFVNPDGSVTVDVNFENTEFEGFINYGSGIFPSGTSGVIPVNGQVGNPRFFNPFLNQNQILVPIFSTTRISTQVLVQPTVNGGLVKVDMIPQLKIDNNEKDVEPQVVNLTNFRTAVNVRNNGLGKVNGFEGASGEFNRNFLGGKEDQEGTNAIIIKAQVFHGEVKEEKVEPKPEQRSQSEAMNEQLEKEKAESVEQTQPE